MKKSDPVLMITEYYYPHWTGISKSFYYLAESVKSQGYQVTVLTTKYDKNLKEKCIVNGIKIIRVPYNLRLSRTHYSFLIVIDYLKRVRMYRYIIINSPNSNILFYAVIAKILKKKLIVYHQGDIIMPKLTGHKVINFIIEGLFDVLTIPSLMLADINSTFTSDYASHSRVMKYFKSKFFPYIPNIKINNKSLNKKLDNKLKKLKKQGKMIGFAGRFVEEKGFDILLSTIDQVNKKLGMTFYVFAGKTDIDYEPFFQHTKSLIDKYKSRIVFLGLLNENDLAVFYKYLDVFVISSRSDCFALTQIEAVKSKVPLVVTNIPGARMLVKTSGYGEIADANNPDSLADKIITVIKNRSQYQKKHQSAINYLYQYGQFKINPQIS